MNVVVVIPVYTFNLSKYESISFLNNILMLSSYDIFIACPKDIDLGTYSQIIAVRNIKLAKFNACWFRSYKAYNALCMQKMFYERFSKYDYMLICQNDSWIFKDDLLKWCNKGYDYVGAPLCHYCKHHAKCLYNECPDDHHKGIIGNGGLSLRKIQKFIESSKIISNEIHQISIDELPNEDDFFMNHEKIKWNVPSCKEALEFSIESMALFHVMHGIHPMGYHNLLKINTKAAVKLHHMMKMNNNCNSTKYEKECEMSLITMRDKNGKQGIADIIKCIKEKYNDSRKLTMIEVGSYQGESMEAFIQTGCISKIICIDPWKPGYDSKDIASSSDMTEVEKSFDVRTKNLCSSSDIVKFKGTLDDFIKSNEFIDVKDNIDLTYVDACHTYEGCKHDLLICKDIIHPKIAFAGHDYVSCWNGVINAVNEMFGKPDKTFIDYSWLKFA